MIDNYIPIFESKKNLLKGKLDSLLNYSGNFKDEKGSPVELVECIKDMDDLENFFKNANIDVTRRINVYDQIESLAEKLKNHLQEGKNFNKNLFLCRDLITLDDYYKMRLFGDIYHQSSKKINCNMNESFKEIDSHLQKIDFQNVFKKMEKFKTKGV